MQIFVESPLHKINSNWSSKQILSFTKGGRSAKITYILRLSANVALCGFAIFRPNLFVICGLKPFCKLKTSNSSEIHTFSPYKSIRTKFYTEKTFWKTAFRPVLRHRNLQISDLRINRENLRICILRTGTSQKFADKGMHRFADFRLRTCKKKFAFPPLRVLPFSKLKKPLQYVCQVPPSSFCAIFIQGSHFFKICANNTV